MMTLKHAPGIGATLDQFTSRTTKAVQASQAYWLDQYQAVQRLRSDGFNIKQITSRLLIDRKTVRKYFYATQFPERAKHRAAKKDVPTVCNFGAKFGSKAIQSHKEKAKTLLNALAFS